MKWRSLAGILTFVLGICFNAALLILVVYLIYVYALKGYYFGTEYSEKLVEVKADKEVEFVLAEDTPLAEAAKQLEELGVINDQYFYRLEIFLKGSSTYYKAGNYTLNQNMKNTIVNATLRAGPVEIKPDNQITIPEGYSVRDIATYLEDNGLVTAAEFVEAANTHSFSYAFLNDIPPRDNRLEGYLFPDTYFISAEPTADEIINKMLARFDEIYSDELRSRAGELGLTMDQVVTMASIIEKEVRVAEERSKVSQVIYNRLEIDMPLQMCSTVLYVLDKKRDRLLESDLQVESPYNTYMNGGLPVGPIANPGVDCLRAALFPEGGSDLLYFVLQDEETGQHFFTSSFDEHVAARMEYDQPF